MRVPSSSPCCILAWEWGIKGWGRERGKDVFRPSCYGLFVPPLISAFLWLWLPYLPYPYPKHAKVHTAPLLLRVGIGDLTYTWFTWGRFEESRKIRIISVRFFIFLLKIYLLKDLSERSSHIDFDFPVVYLPINEEMCKGIGTVCATTNCLLSCA